MKKFPQILIPLLQQISIKSSFDFSAQEVTSQLFLGNKTCSSKGYFSTLITITKLELFENIVELLQNVVELLKKPVELFENPVEMLENPVELLENLVKLLENPVALFENPVKLLENLVEMPSNPEEMPSNPVQLMLENPVEIHGVSCNSCSGFLSE